MLIIVIFKNKRKKLGPNSVYAHLKPVPLYVENKFLSMNENVAYSPSETGFAIYPLNIQTYLSDKLRIFHIKQLMLLCYYVML